MKIVAIIPAKGHSRRLPNKNITSFMGKPMIYWAIKACADSKYEIEVWVSSDSDEVLEIAKEYGAIPYKRNPELAKDNVCKQDVIKDVASYIMANHDIPDAFISLQPNSPEVQGSDLDEGLDELFYSVKGEAMYEIFSVDKNLHQNAVYRMFRSHYLNHKGYSIHAGVVICNRDDIHTKYDLEEAEKRIRSLNPKKTKWESIVRDEIKGDGTILQKESVKWFPDKNKMSNGIDEYMIGEWAPQNPIINKDSNVIVFGDCYAQHTTKFLIDKGLNMSNNGLFFYSSQFVNTFSILEQLEWIIKESSSDDIEWFRGTSIRGSLKKTVLNNDTRNEVRKKFKSADVFILSLGLIEVWFNEKGKSLWRKSLKEEGNERFEVSSFSDNKSNIKKICEYLKHLSPFCKIILQVSPIPFNATFREAPPLSANSVSKNILRGAVDEFLREYQGEGVYYYPSYELVTHCIKNPYEDDNRHLTQEALNYVLELFGKYYLED